MAASLPAAACPVLLGYPDEPAGGPGEDPRGRGRGRGGEREVHFTESAIGGRPSLPPSTPASALESEVRCALCGDARPLLAQIYAPLDGSPFHRVLYVLACVRQDCWGRQESWTCLRTQALDSTYGVSARKSPAEAAAAITTEVTDWLGGADDWDDDDDGDLRCGADEENGNKMEVVGAAEAMNRMRLEEDNAGPVPMQQTPSPDITLSEDLSAVTNPSSESSTTSTSGLGGDTNANLSSPDAAGAAAGPVPSPSFGGAAATASFASEAAVATAEIEADEGEPGDDAVIAVDVAAERDLLLHGNTLIPQLFFGAKDNNTAAAASAVSNQQRHPNTSSETSNTARANPCFRQLYLAVDEEKPSGDKSLPEHDRQLLMEYRAREEAEGSRAKAKAVSGTGGGDQDGYEKSVPKHGDVWFHKFVSVIRDNPGQVLRYYRRDSGHSPLFMSKPHHAMAASASSDLYHHQRKSSASSGIRCESCGGGAVCELQLLPSLINSLHPADPNEDFSIEFGTALIFTCNSSCWSSSTSSSKPSAAFRREKVFLQSEVL